MQGFVAGEQVPQHELQVVQEDGQQKLLLTVKLPGLSSASDIQLACTSSSISLTVPGQYALLLPLDVTISDAADSVKYMKKKQTLSATFTVITADKAAAAAGVANGSSNSSSAGQQQQQADAVQRAAAAAAAEEAARREQQRWLNTEAAEEWLRRGLDAARSGNCQLAEKALGKVGELAPHLNTAALRSAIAAAKQQQQQRRQQNGPQPTPGGSAANGSSQQQQRQQPPQQPQPKQPQQQPPPPPPPQQQQQQQQRHAGASTQPSSSSRNSAGANNAQQQSSSKGGAGQQQAGNANSSSGGRPSNQQQQQKQQPQQKQQQNSKHKHKQKGQPPPQKPQQGPGSSSTAGNGPSQQQQQQHDDADEDFGFSRSAWEQQQAAKELGGGGLVGWWCRRYDALEMWVVMTGDQLNAWSKEEGRRWLAATAAQLCAVALVATHFAVMWLWRTGWTQPLHVAAYIRRTGGDTFIESQLWLGRTAIILTQHTLMAAFWRLSLCSVSAACAAAAAWAVGWLQLWGHSMVGWCWVLLCGTWRALVWRPWHSVQLPLAVVAVFVFGFAGLGGDIALWSLAMMLMPGGWLNLIGWAVAAAASFGLLPFAPRIRWPTGLSGIILMTNAVNYGCSWWGFKAFSSPVDPLPRVSWWWWLLLAALHVFVALMQTAERMREEEEAAKHGGSSSSNFGRRHSEDEPFYGGASEMAYQKFVMGFGAVPVPEGCEVAEVKAALQAKDYYQVMGFSSREECTPESLRAARKAKALAVHPDKVGHDHPGANQAAGRVNKAFETLSSEDSRRAYDRLLDCHSRPRAATGSGRRAAAGGRAATPDDASWLPPYSDSLYDIERMPAYMTDMDCPAGGHSHTVYILPQAPFGVRWCRECGAWHNTREGGEVWAHWSPGLGGVRMLGRVRLLLAPSPNSPIFDITDVFKCGGQLVSSPEMCNTHGNRFADIMSAGRAARRGGGGGGGDVGGSRRSRKKQGRRR